LLRMKTYSIIPILQIIIKLYGLYIGAEFTDLTFLVRTFCDTFRSILYEPDLPERIEHDYEAFHRV